MNHEHNEGQLNRLIFAFTFGIVGCLLLATCELITLMTEDWFSGWVNENSFTNERIIRYGLAFFVALTAIFLAVYYTPKATRFSHAINRAVLWYGVILLLGAIISFLFDCLPEVIAGIVGAGIFIGSIYLMQQRYYTAERVISIRVRRGECPDCGYRLSPEAYFCPDCGHAVGQKCSECKGFAKLTDQHCSHCGKPLSTAS